MFTMEIVRATQKTLAVILAGGRGQRLMDLTRDQAKPGLDFGGKFKIIDFTLSNCVNSGVRRVLVLTQYNSHQLLEHLQLGWTFLPAKLGEFVHVLPAEQNHAGDLWYAGTADAVYQNLQDLKARGPEHILILAGDHVYKMDYRLFLEDHVYREADATVACLEVPREQATGFGVASVDDQDRIVGWIEKPEDPPGIPDKPHLAFASMGIYLFRAEFLYEILQRDAEEPTSSHDFGKDVIPYLVEQGTRIYAHRFTRSCIPNLDKPPYWRDVGTLDAYWEASMDLTAVDPALNLYDTAWPVLTHQEQLPPAKFVHSGPHRNGMAIASVVSGGCIVSGAMVYNSLLSSRVRAHSHAHIQDSVILPDVDIARHARLRRCIVARGCCIPEGLVVGEDPVLDAQRFHRTPGGVTLISQRMLDRLAL